MIRDVVCQTWLSFSNHRNDEPDEYNVPDNGRCLRDCWKGHCRQSSVFVVCTGQQIARDYYVDEDSHNGSPGKSSMYLSTACTATTMRIFKVEDVLARVLVDYSHCTTLKRVAQTCARSPQVGLAF